MGQDHHQIGCVDGFLEYRKQVGCVEASVTMKRKKVVIGKPSFLAEAQISSKYGVLVKKQGYKVGHTSGY